MHTLKFSEWLEERDQELHESIYKNIAKWGKGLAAGAGLAASLVGCGSEGECRVNNPSISTQIPNLSMSVTRDQDESGKTFHWTFTFKNAPSERMAVETAKKEVKEELMRMYGGGKNRVDVSGITANWSKDAKGNIIVDVAKLNTMDVINSMK